MKYNKINPNLFIKNRKKLSCVLNANSVAVVFSADEFIRNGDQTHKYRQNSDLFYLSGIEQEKTILLLIPDEAEKEILFIIRPNEKMETWNGHKLTKQEAQEISGIENIKFIDEFDETLNKILPKYKEIYIGNTDTKTQTEYITIEKRFEEKLKIDFPNHKFSDLFEFLHPLRTIKEPEEIEIIKQACEITKNTFFEILKTTKANIKEFEIEAKISYEFAKRGAEHAYLPIVASGKNACTLHYISNDKTMNNGELLLLDFGAEYANYASDCSRTIPVNGKFTERQKACYNAVLKVFNEIKKQFVVGNTIQNINQQANKLMEKEMINLGLFTEKDVENQNPENPLCKKYFMHGTSHFMGLDVHDVGKKTEILQKGMILTCEPGIYIEAENIGIRIENNILIDDEPIDLMAEIPLEIDEIEKLMQK